MLEQILVLSTPLYQLVHEPPQRILRPGLSVSMPSGLLGWEQQSAVARAASYALLRRPMSGWKMVRRGHGHTGPMQGTHVLRTGELRGDSVPRWHLFKPIGCNLPGNLHLVPYRRQLRAGLKGCTGVLPRLIYKCRGARKLRHMSCRHISAHLRCHQMRVVLCRALLPPWSNSGHSMPSWHILHPDGLGCRLQLQRDWAWVFSPKWLDASKPVQGWLVF